MAYFVRLTVQLQNSVCKTEILHSTENMFIRDCGGSASTGGCNDPGPDSQNITFLEYSRWPSKDHRVQVKATRSNKSCLRMLSYAKQKERDCSFLLGNNNLSC